MAMEQIDDINELFGNAEVKAAEELAQYDSNVDGVISQEDSQFNELLVWQDKNSDGISQQDELKTLSEHQISEISLNYTSVSNQGTGSVLSEIGQFTYTDGTTGQAADILLERNSLHSKYNRDFEINPEVNLLPDIKGYGELPQLSIAMSLDNELLEMVKNSVGNENFRLFD